MAALSFLQNGIDGCQDATRLGHVHKMTVVLRLGLAFDQRNWRVLLCYRIPPFASASTSSDRVRQYNAAKTAPLHCYWQTTTTLLK